MSLPPVTIDAIVRDEALIFTILSATTSMLCIMSIILPVYRSVSATRRQERDKNASTPLVGKRRLASRLQSIPISVLRSVLKRSTFQFLLLVEATMSLLVDAMALAYEQKLNQPSSFSRYCSSERNTVFALHHAAIALHIQLSLFRAGEFTFLFVKAPDKPPNESMWRRLGHWLFPQRAASIGLEQQIAEPNHGEKTQQPAMAAHSPTLKPPVVIISQTSASLRSGSLSFTGQYQDQSSGMIASNTYLRMAFLSRIKLPAHWVVWIGFSLESFRRIILILSPVGIAFAEYSTFHRGCVHQFPTQALEDSYWDYNFDFRLTVFGLVQFFAVSYITLGLSCITPLLRFRSILTAVNVMEHMRQAKLHMRCSMAVLVLGSLASSKLPLFLGSALHSLMCRFHLAWQLAYIEAMVPVRNEVPALQQSQPWANMVGEVSHGERKPKPRVGLLSASFVAGLDMFAKSAASLVTFRMSSHDVSGTGSRPSPTASPPGAGGSGAGGFLSPHSAIHTAPNHHQGRQQLSTSPRNLSFQPAPEHSSSTQLTISPLAAQCNPKSMGSLPTLIERSRRASLKVAAAVGIPSAISEQQVTFPLNPHAPSESMHMASGRRGSEHHSPISPSHGASQQFSNNNINTRTNNSELNSRTLTSTGRRGSMQSARSYTRTDSEKVSGGTSPQFLSANSSILDSSSMHTPPEFSPRAAAAAATPTRAPGLMGTCGVQASAPPPPSLGELALLPEMDSESTTSTASATSSTDGHGLILATTIALSTEPPPATLHGQPGAKGSFPRGKAVGIATASQSRPTHASITSRQSDLPRSSTAGSSATGAIAPSDTSLFTPPHSSGAIYMTALRNDSSSVASSDSLRNLAFSSHTSIGSSHLATDVHSLVHTRNTIQEDSEPPPPAPPGGAMTFHERGQLAVASCPIATDPDNGGMQQQSVLVESGTTGREQAVLFLPVATLDFYHSAHVGPDTQE
ncbi:hypothetical protein BCR44DRAFT_1323276 [Catenaria anguillulae PL171]|uniref:Uncharacterized protein n=1 Tax=Catenaria anguillulae PL171 TaxID=765915 RepID=A0A1Y2HWN0_9FUNG|nr:hypothetical protein BCR44DRAFT_1323276 [Catenaria anguillulae PL171]